MLFIYNVIVTIFLPFILIYRLFIGKEDYRYLCERLGYSTRSRPNKRIIWIHAASVGESLVALTLVDNLKKNYSDAIFLLTSGTITSHKLIIERAVPEVIHQYIPVDHFISISIFLKKWHPDLALIIEGELWPNLLLLTQKYCNILLLNARISEKSYQKWKKCKFIIRHLLKSIDVIITQSKSDFYKYKELGGKNVINLGNMKYAAKPYVDDSKIQILKKKLQGRLIISAISTHFGDEEMIIKILTVIKKINSNIVLLLVPRHPKRCNSVIKICQKYGYNVSLRSKDEYFDKTTSVYLVDTIGELNVINSISRITIIGGSFNHHGHNPIEAAWHDTVIVFGPDMNNFYEVATNFVKEKAAIQVNDEAELTQVITTLSSNSISELQHYWKSAQNLVLTYHVTILQSYLQVVNKYLDYDKVTIS